MKIIITGSLGNISKPLAQELVKKARYDGYYQQVIQNQDQFFSFGI